MDHGNNFSLFLELKMSSFTAQLSDFCTWKPSHTMSEDFNEPFVRKEEQKEMGSLEHDKPRRPHHL